MPSGLLQVTFALWRTIYLDSKSCLTKQLCAPVCAVATVRDYELDGDDAIHAVRLMRSALHGFVALEAGGGFAMGQSVDETFDRLVALLDAGLRDRS